MDKINFKEDKYNSSNIENSIKLAFDYYDENKNGFLNRKEIKKMLIDTFLDDCSNEFEMNEDFIDVFIETLDINGDGKITFKELKKVLLPLINNLKIEN